MTVSILKELEEKLPPDAKISEVKFEGSEIVLYTKSKEFFRESEGPIREIVSNLKKRVEIRPDVTITTDPEKAKEIINKIVPEDAGIKALYFEHELGKVFIECQKPGLVIGKGGETYKKIKNQTLWLPKIERAPALDSKIVRAVRNLLHSELDYRKKFLNKIGQMINTKTISLEDKKKEWVRLACLGGFRQVGRSCMMVETPYSNILMDCGIDVSASGEDSIPNINIPEFNLEKIDAICLSHAHIDHCGFIPYLYEQGFTGPLYSTAPTRDLMVLLCMDYIDVAQKEGRNMWYSKKAIEKAIKHSVVLDYGEVSDITPDVRLTLQPAGHLLGSALVHLHIGEGLYNILYSGDYKFGPTRLFDPAFTDFQRIETLITESTYGGAENNLPPRKEAESRFFEVVENTINRGGKVLIPVFAVGRAQEVMAVLAGNNFQHPVYIEGMVWDATAIHTAYPEYLSQYLQRKIFHYGENPFLSNTFRHIVPKERNSVIDSSEPGIVLATSGMLIGGPAIEYLKAFAYDEKNTLLFVGYQGEGTLGSRIQKGWKEIPLTVEGGRTKTLELKMSVETVSGFTGHSGRNQLVNFVRDLTSKPERIIVNHGEQKRAMELARDLHRMYRIETVVPKNLEVVRLK